jgi:hypothetical protein
VDNIVVINCDKGNRKMISENISGEVGTVRKEIGMFQKPHEAHISPGLVSVKDTELCSMQ